MIMGFVCGVVGGLIVYTLLMLVDGWGISKLEKDIAEISNAIYDKSNGSGISNSIWVDWYLTPYGKRSSGILEKIENMKKENAELEKKFNVLLGHFKLEYKEEHKKFISPAMKKVK